MAKPRVVLVLSGKGGVGKSTVSAQLAAHLALSGRRVGLLDVDLCGPSIARLLKLEDAEIVQSEQGWVPASADPAVDLRVMSIAFLLPDRNAPVVWRGPKKEAMIGQFLDDVAWGELDYLVVDTPPGTSDEHIAFCQKVQRMTSLDLEGAVLVTTPQRVAVADVRREITFCRKVSLPILGIFENMSGYVCPHCSDCTNIFSKGGGQSLASFASVPFLGALPIDPALMKRMVGDGTLAERFPPSPSTAPIRQLVDKLNERTAQDQ